MNQLALNQEEFGHIVLQDITFICFIGIILASLIHGWLRKISPQLQWNQIGKVSTLGYGTSDIFICLAICFPFYSELMIPYQPPKGDSLSPGLLILNFTLFLFIAGVVLLIFHRRGQLPDALGLNPEHPAQVISWSIAAYIVIFIVNIILNQIGIDEWIGSRLGEKQNQQIVDELISSEENQKLFIMILGACVVAPIAEEIVFRGYFYPILKRYTEPIIAAILTGIIFGTIHGQIWAVIPLSLFGILLAILYEKSGSIWSCILCHAMFNAINVIFMLTMGDQL